jgi:hypothetical protein
MKTDCYIDEVTDDFPEEGIILIQKNLNNIVNNIKPKEKNSKLCVQYGNDTKRGLILQTCNGIFYTANIINKLNDAIMVITFEEDNSIPYGFQELKFKRAHIIYINDNSVKSTKNTMYGLLEVFVKSLNENENYLVNLKLLDRIEKHDLVVDESEEAPLIMNHIKMVEMIKDLVDKIEIID